MIFAPALKTRGSSFNPDAHGEADQTSEVRIDGLIEWALKKGFKSEFLGNLENDMPKEVEQNLSNIPTAKSLNINETRIQAFKFWVAGKGGAENVEQMKKNEVWDELQKIDGRLFNSGKDAFFEDNKTKQSLVKFKAGKRSN